MHPSGPRILWRPDPLRERSERDERDRALWVRGREQNAHHTAFGVAKDGGSLRPGRIHHRTEVVHPLLQRRQVSDRDWIREARTSFVEQQEPRERRQPFQEPAIV